MTENEKLKKTIEIIKNNFSIELKFTKHSDRSENYNKYYLIVNHTLTTIEKEEYELLKEVLENDNN